jgi:hypothetical protein
MNQKLLSNLKGSSFLRARAREGWDKGDTSFFSSFGSAALRAAISRDFVQNEF